MLPPPRETAVVRGPIPWGRCAQPDHLAAVRAVRLPGLRLVFLHHLAADLPARGARHGREVGALLAALPLLFGGIGCLVSARSHSRADARRRQRVCARRILAVIGFAGASTSSSCSSRIADPMTAMLLLGFAGSSTTSSCRPAWAGCMDIGGRYSGTVSGTMNMVGNIGGALVADGRRLHADLDRASWIAHLLHLVGDLPAWARSAGCSSTRKRRSKKLVFYL